MEQATTSTAESPTQASETLRRRITNPFLMRLYMLKSLPLGFMAGLRVDRFDGDVCAVSVPYGWRTTNPFRSTYFAAQSMAAELSTGAMAMYAVAQHAVPNGPGEIAMLIVDLQATFGKKATDRATFVCEQGAVLRQAVARTVASGEAATATVETVGRMANGVEVARFSFTWSFKRRSF
jgi:hypothetical protein